MTSRPRPVPSQGRRGAAPDVPRPLAWLRHPALGSALVALLMYLSSLGHGFVRDDHQLIGDNSFMHNAGFLRQLLTTDFWGSVGGDSGLWRPLITLSYWLDGRLGGWLPITFHTVNVVSHALVTAVLALLMVEVGAPVAAAWCAALWFAVMPVHVESVAWISGRTDLWCALFGLLTLWLHERGARGRPLGWRIASALALVLALFSKETAVVIPAVLAILVVRRLGLARPWPVFAELLPSVLLTVGWALLHHRMAPGAIAATPGWRHPAPNEGLWTALAVLPGQLAYLLPGFPLGPDFAMEPAHSPADPRVAMGVVLHLLALFVVIRATPRRDGLGAAAWLLWLPVALISALPLLRHVLLNGGRHFYLPSAGAAWLLGVGVLALWKRGLSPSTLPRGLVPAAFVVLLVSCMAQSAVAIRGWHDDETMYRAMINAQPKNATGYLGLALVKIGQRRDPTALRAIQMAERLDSTRYEIATYRAAIESRANNWPEVIHWARAARVRGATEADAPLMEVAALQSLNRLPESSQLLDTLMVRFKQDPDVAAAFGREMLLEKRAARAVGPLRYAVSWAPNDASLALLLGDAYVHVGQMQMARDEIRRGVGLDPGNIEAWVRLASVCYLMNDIEGRDAALKNAASLPGADQARLRALWDKMKAASTNP